MLHGANFGDSDPSSGSELILWVNPFTNGAVQSIPIDRQVP